MISKSQARKIINTLKSVISEDINFIAPDGYIIASSDERRVGTLHQGALIVAESKKQLIISKDNEYEGAKKGINLPVFHNQNLIAIVGITGEPLEIIKFSNVIVKMSEILIKEHFLNTQKQFKRENNRLIMELIVKDKFNPEIVKIKMDELSYNTNFYKYFIVFDVLDYDSYNTEILNNIYDSIERRLDYNDLLSRLESKYLVLSQKDELEDLIKEIEKIKLYLENKYNIKLTIGISEKIKDVKDYYTSYKQANTVVELGANKGSGIIQAFDSTSLSLLFQGFSNYFNFDFSHHVFKNLNIEQMKEAKEMILAYIRNNGSITKASESLFIHKNTFQYRLNKIHELTGYNPRNLEDLIYLYVAIHI
ncbi:MAG: sugar diacid recognition domain-containing protein [Acholeplasmataceae bacterium]